MKAATLFLLLACLATAEFEPGEKVPLERLMTNVKTRFASYQNQAEAHYLLGRLESLAFTGEESVLVFRDKNKKRLPELDFLSQEWPKTGPHAVAFRAKELFFSSIEHYRHAISLDPNNSFYHFSLGWMAEQGQRLSLQLGAPPDALSGNGKTTTWRMLAIREYQTASRMSPPPTDSYIAPILAQQSREALITVLREEIQERGKSLRTDLDNAFIADAERQITENLAILEGIKKLPQAFTPLIFSTRPHAHFADLLSLSQVSFDLGGFGEDRKWPWLQPDTAILVWDPANEGHIRSGRQLFGSVTWWMFWHNGFEPLAALDDNVDGQLAGRELDGIAVWQDKNGNGISDPGEVIPASQFGIVALDVHPGATIDGVLAARNGVVTRENSFTFYDWQPTSSALPTLSSRAGSASPLSLAVQSSPRPAVR